MASNQKNSQSVIFSWNTIKASQYSSNFEYQTLNPLGNDRPGINNLCIITEIILQKPSTFRNSREL